MRLSWGLRLGRGFRIRPYMVLRLGSWSPGGKRKQTVIATCTDCGAVNRLDARYCSRCGSKFSGRILPP